MTKTPSCSCRTTPHVTKQLVSSNSLKNTVFRWWNGHPNRPTSIPSKIYGQNLKHDSTNALPSCSTIHRRVWKLVIDMARFYKRFVIRRGWSWLRSWLRVCPGVALLLLLLRVDGQSTEPRTDRSCYILVGTSVSWQLEMVLLRSHCICPPRPPLIFVDLWPWFRSRGAYCSPGWQFSDTEWMFLSSTVLTSLIYLVGNGSDVHSFAVNAPLPFYSHSSNGYMYAGVEARQGGEWDNC